MTIVKDDLALVPLPCGLEVTLVEIGDIHGVVHGASLPRLKHIAVVHLSEVIIVNQLIFRTSDIRDLEDGILDDMVHHAAVAALADLPLPLEVEVGVFLFGNDISISVASTSVSLDGTIDDSPRAGQLLAIIIPPTIK